MRLSDSDSGVQCRPSVLCPARLISSLVFLGSHASTSASSIHQSLTSIIPAQITRGSGGSQHASTPSGLSSSGDTSCH
ncbi:uncharacterized protein BO95DRAFT_79812 [Aspergillus brunneoviolaceus CBS 621.78]|uniref:Uncharacterized protein n=1 Tax=Aspergillus brunneoviolaceus CBS 621.78 TaxID=1450534 RepID=A0ACD1GEA5_9EURO|nr:hypothetical protein BO95DRAFT_79812 [Aspergillus brunneoviolaceus CBS 621.78]RAH47570.1 hypothetical protein BO95DRAFT_79812 [Aspergillus brunneoviolaceus CBS 621.78]